MNTYQQNSIYPKHSLQAQSPHSIINKHQIQSVHLHITIDWIQLSIDLPLKPIIDSLLNNDPIK
jgi:hypothetical protein